MSNNRFVRLKTVRIYDQLFVYNVDEYFVNPAYIVMIVSGKTYSQVKLSTGDVLYAKTDELPFIQQERGYETH